MKKQFHRILMLVATVLSINVVLMNAQAASDATIVNQINSLDAEVRTKQKRLLELRLQQLKQEQEEIQNELKNSHTSITGLTPSEGLLPTLAKTVSEKSIIKIETPPGKENSSSKAQGQTTDPKCNAFTLLSRSPFDNNLCALSIDFRTNADLRANEKNLAVLIMYLAQTDESIKAFITKFENKRTDKQVGGGPMNKGTTSLVVKGGAPAIIGWAIENGAATSDISGTTVNIKVNPIGLLDAIANTSNHLPFGDQFTLPASSPIKFSVKDPDDSFTKFAKKASFGFSFDTNRGTDPPAFIGSKQQLSAVSFRYEFVNHRNPLRTEFNNDWNAFFQSQIGTLTNQLDSVGLLLKDRFDPNREFRNAQLENWIANTQAELEILPLGGDGKRDLTAIREKIEERLKLLPISEILKDEALKKTLENFAESGAKYSAASGVFLDKLNKGTIATFEYTNNRNVDSPDTSNFNFIVEGGRKVGSGLMDLTFNGSLTIFNKKPSDSNVKRIKDFNFALQADFPMPKFIDSVLSFSGKYVRQVSDLAMANGLVTPNTKGDIAVGQVKLTIPIPDWGIRLPLSVTFANRTELIKESTVRGNFGITFDLDPIFGHKQLF